MSFDAESCGARIRSLRKKHGFSKKRLAEAMNITNWYLRQIESGAGMGSAELLAEFADYFHVPLDYIIPGKKNPAEEKYSGKLQTGDSPFLDNDRGTMYDLS